MIKQTAPGQTNIKVTVRGNLILIKKENQVVTRTKQTRILSLLSIQLISVFFIAGVAAALEVGEQAPDFTLPSTSGAKFSLSQFQGKKHVLIQFYTMDFQPT